MIPRTSPFPAAEPTPLSTLGWPTARLFECHPPRWDDHRKSAIFNDISSSGTPFAGRVTFRRWSVAAQLPDLLLRPTGARLLICPFHYPSTPPGCVEWHMNVADPSLFGFYGSSLFAQDEIQVAEHPALACVREALLAIGSPARTTGPDGSPTPCTITGVERRCMIDFLPGDDLPDGLYGKNFARRDLSAILARTRPLHPPTRSNILAMAAPACGRGNYQLRELHDILLGAYTGFRAAALESALIDPSSRRTIIHTGLWGCGAFGGNPLVMVALQCLAADLAGVHPVFHASPADRAGEIRLGISLALDAVRDGRGCPQAALEYLEKSGFSRGHRIHNCIACALEKMIAKIGGPSSLHGLKSEPNSYRHSPRPHFREIRRSQASLLSRRDHLSCAEIHDAKKTFPATGARPSPQARHALRGWQIGGCVRHGGIDRSEWCTHFVAHFG